MKLEPSTHHPNISNAMRSSTISNELLATIHHEITTKKERKRKEGSVVILFSISIIASNHLLNITLTHSSDIYHQKAHLAEKLWKMDIEIFKE